MALAPPMCKGAEPLVGGSAYFAAFAQFEHALAFSRANAGTERPLALHVRRPLRSIVQPMA